MERVLAAVRDDPAIEAMTFQQLTFWGGPDYTVDGWNLRRGAGAYHRFFKWGRVLYATHRPPTVTDESGHDLRDGTGSTRRRRCRWRSACCTIPCCSRSRWRRARTTRPLPGPSAPGPSPGPMTSMREPTFGVHNLGDLPSWLERYDGSHPEQVLQMLDDLKSESRPGRTEADRRHRPSAQTPAGIDLVVP